MGFRVVVVVYFKLNIFSSTQAIYCAARNGHFKVVEFLLECKADPNKQQEVCMRVCVCV